MKQVYLYFSISILILIIISSILIFINQTTISSKPQNIDIEVMQDTSVEDLPNLPELNDEELNPTLITNLNEELERELDTLLDFIKIDDLSSDDFIDFENIE